MKVVITIVSIILLCIVFFGGDSEEPVNCHLKAKIVEIGKCTSNGSNRAECSISYRNDGNISLDYGTLDGGGVVNQPLYQNCFNKGDGQRCYTKLEKQLDEDYGNRCSLTPRYNNYELNKPILRSNLQKIYDWILPIDKETQG